MIKKVCNVCGIEKFWKYQKIKNRLVLRKIPIKVYPDVQLDDESHDVPSTLVYS